MNWWNIKTDAENYPRNNSNEIIIRSRIHLLKIKLRVWFYILSTKSIKIDKIRHTS